MPNRLVPALSSIAWLAATAALAQPASPPDAKAAPSEAVAPVTVVGMPPKMIHEEAKHFVRSHAKPPNPELNQFGRWHDPVCVVVLGLPQEDQAAEIKARIEGVAAAVGLRAGKPDCRPDVEIVFNPKPQHVMDIVAKQREYLLGYYHFHERNKLKTVTRPIQSWYVTATSSFGGSVAGKAFEIGANHAANNVLGVMDDPENRTPNGCGEAPHFTHCLQSRFDNVFIVADSAVLDGKELGAVADYMAMLVLTKPLSLDGCGALPSVIDLFATTPCSGRDPPDGLTPSDAAYLTALYKADLEAVRQFEESDIADRMAAILIKASAEAQTAR
jgi:hypothetical protein